MNALTKFIRGLIAIIRSPRLISAVLHDQRYWKERFNNEFGQSDVLPSIPLTTFLSDRSILEQYSFSGDASMVTDLLVLKKLAMRESVRSYCEIGTWRGESARAVAPHVDQVVTIDLPENAMRQSGVDQTVIDQVGILVKSIDSVKCVREDSTTMDFSALGGKFDLIFIDGDHRAEYVTRDTKNVFHHLCHEKSIVVWHDYGIDPDNVRWEVYYGIMKGVPAGTMVKHVSGTKCAIAGGNWPGVESNSKDAPLWRVTLDRRT